MPLSNREFNAKVAKERRDLGGYAELIVGADCSKRGYVPFYPIITNPKYDIIVDKNGVLLRLQVKSLNRQSNQIPLGSTKKYQERVASRWNSPMPRLLPRYCAGDFDYLAGVDRSNGLVYYVPSSDIDFSKPTVSMSQSNKILYAEF